MSIPAILDNVNAYYSAKIREHGATSKGVDWNTEDSQFLRFRQLLRVLPEAHGTFSLVDYGCGYGALYEFLTQEFSSKHSIHPETFPSKFEYIGYDISAEMLASAGERFGQQSNVRLTQTTETLTTADYLVASGIFNVRMHHNDTEWKDYILETLQTFDAIAKHGFSFNMLTSYSDKEYMRTDLYYADSLFFFDYCKRRFSKYVALLHDYPLYEFTIVVKKNL